MDYRGVKRGVWDKGRRAIYLKPFVNDEGETVFPFARETDRIIYTNLGIDEELKDIFIKAGKEEYFMREKSLNHTIIEVMMNLFIPL
ncbi:MAG: hypothetical protein ACP5SB_05575 [Caldisericaceae bacterium]